MGTSYKDFYIEDRLQFIDPIFLKFEEDRAKKEDLDKIFNLCQDFQFGTLPNPHNSIILYITGLSDEFDFDRQRCDTKGGSPPDIDLDYDVEGREAVLNWIVESFGKDNVANIGTIGTFGLRSLTKRFFSVTEPSDPTLIESHYNLQYTIEKEIPQPLFGVEATLKEFIEGNPSKDYEPHPHFKDDDKYKDWYDFVSNLDGMIANQSVHACGMVISNFPIHEQIPLYKTGDYERITQFEMGQIEELGLIKFDFLVINNLSILKQCVSLIKQRHNIDYDIYSIPDGDVKAYKLFAEGKLTGIFQFEQSDTIKRASIKSCPKTIEDLSDLSSLVRPGPAKAGFLDRYLDHDPDPKIHPSIKEMWSSTRHVLIYQEQLIKLFTEVAKMTLEEGEAARRAVGKKDAKYLEKLKPKFFEGCTRFGLSENQIAYLWDVIYGCSDYLFNKSHSIAYSYVSYLCAFFKANYPLEFFCSLMTVRSMTMQPKDWASKAPEYVSEANDLGVNIHAPYIQRSSIGFTIQDDSIYFGLNGIRSCGAGNAKIIIASRGDTPFKDIYDFVMRINTSKVNISVFNSLIKSGCFDFMGYKRQDLLDNAQALYDYKNDLLEYETRASLIRSQQSEIEYHNKLMERKDELKKIQKLKKGRALTEEELLFLEEHSSSRRMTPLKPKDEPVIPEIIRYKKISISLDEMMEQFNYIGCFLGKHPARLIAPHLPTLSTLEEGYTCMSPAIVTSIKIITTKKGDKMLRFEANDGTAAATVILFPKDYKKYIASSPELSVGDLIILRGLVKKTEPSIEILSNNIQLVRGHAI